MSATQSTLHRNKPLMRADEAPDASVSSLLNAADVQVDTSSFARFTETFPLQGEALYEELFQAHRHLIQTQKTHFAVANLQKIFAATFATSVTSGFSRMTLRDLSRATGMSMGAIYSCINKKEDIVVMVSHVVRLSSELTRRHSSAAGSAWERIKASILFHLYASTLLQDWYFFLFFETRSLPEGQQKNSTRIEVDAIRDFSTNIQAGIDAGEFTTSDPSAVANAIVVMLEDWYLKPWKNNFQRESIDPRQSQGVAIESYNQRFIELLTAVLQR